MPASNTGYTESNSGRKPDPLSVLLAAARRRRESLGIGGEHPELTRRDCAAAAVALLAGLALEAARIAEVGR